MSSTSIKPIKLIQTVAPNFKLFSHPSTSSYHLSSPGSNHLQPLQSLPKLSEPDQQSPAGSILPKLSPRSSNLLRIIPMAFIFPMSFIPLHSSKLLQHHLSFLTPSSRFRLLLPFSLPIRYTVERNPCRYNATFYNANSLLMSQGISPAYVLFAVSDLSQHVRGHKCVLEGGGGGQLR